jgi:hypothetical protein
MMKLLNAVNEELNKAGIVITKLVGTMVCAVIFAVTGGTGVYFALTNNVKGVLIIGSISGYFLQLVLLPIIMVGQNLQSKKTDALHRDVKKIKKHHKII